MLTICFACVHTYIHVYVSANNEGWAYAYTDSGVAEATVEAELQSVRAWFFITTRYVCSLVHLLSSARVCVRVLFIHTDMRTYINACIHVYIHAYMHTCIHVGPEKWNRQF